MECENQSDNTSSRLSLTFAMNCLHYSSIFLHGLNKAQGNSTDCPLTYETCTMLDSFHLLRQPCPDHHHETDTVILPKKRKRWRHRGRRGGRRLKNIPIKPSFRPIHPHLSALNNNNLTGVIPNDTQNNNPDTYLNARLWNAQSLRNKTITVSDSGKCGHNVHNRDMVKHK